MTNSVSDSDFKLAVNYLLRLTTDQPASLLKKFDESYGKQSQVMIAIKILNAAAEEGSEKQKKKISLCSRHVEKLNELLKNEDNVATQLFQSRIASSYVEATLMAQSLKGIRIDLPQSKLEKAFELLSSIPRVILAILQDLLTLPFAGITNLIGLCVNFNPNQPDQKTIPVLLLHGSGYNETQFTLMRQFLGNNVYSLNYAEGRFSNSKETTVQDYASNDKIKEMIAKIKRETGQDKILIIGHSMGGNVGCEISRIARENPAHFDGVQVPWVITLNSPLKGSPSLDRVFPKDRDERYKDMSIDCERRKKLIRSTLQAERNGLLEIYNMGATTDFACPEKCTMLTEDPRRKRLFSCQGHFTSMVSFRAIHQVHTWVKGIRKNSIKV